MVGFWRPDIHSSELIAILFRALVAERHDVVMLKLGVAVGLNG